MATITKSYTTVLSLQSNAASTVLLSSAQDVSTKLAATIFIWFGRRSATAAGAGCNIRIEGSGASSGDAAWKALHTFTTTYAACESEAVSGTVTSGQKVITVASTSNLTIGDYIYIDNGTIANSEWHRIKSIVTNTSVTVEDDLTNAQTSSTIYDSAEDFVWQGDLTGLARIRIVVDGASFTQAHAVKALMVTGDSIG